MNRPAQRPPRDARLGLSVVIPATDAPATLTRCLAAIAVAEDPPDELILIDDPGIAGSAAARNVGARRAREALVGFVDADIEVHPDAFTRMRAAFHADPGLVAVFGSYDDDPAVEGVISRFRNFLHHHVHQSDGGRAETFWTGLGAIRREALWAHGGFDETLRFGHSSIRDIDLGTRLHAAGARLRLDPLLQGRHLKRWTLRSMLQADLLYRGVPWVVVILESRHLPKRLNLAWRHRLSAGLCLGLLGTAAARRVRPALVGGVAFVLINARLHMLCLRRGGVAVGLASPPLHFLHHLAAVLAVPIGAVTYRLEHHKRRAHPRRRSVEQRKQGRPSALPVAPGVEPPHSPAGEAPQPAVSPTRGRAHLAKPRAGHPLK
jgi:GT2 family glycosyltransferase